ncbi:HCO3 transporter family-domain-containing protein [Phyllosticta citribraziliensis]|uniref:HCO3 transporter family-domain-containing protein n=1 Tax=Phyllosticta citribraziliensis TaxID=989973 RepID=A0ABR1MAZ4_9PEZI
MSGVKTGWFAPHGILRPFRLLRQDLANLPKRYASDWSVFNQLIIASAVYVFFTNLLPGITFASDLYELTGGNWGTIEVVFSTGLCGVIFSLFSIQPLTILGVTGPFSILAENIYSLCESSFHIPFLPFMAWSLIHAGWMHYLLAIFNAHDYTMRYVTTFSTEIFSLLNSIIYFHKAIQELERAHSRLSFAAFLYSVIGCIGTCLLAIFLASAERWKPLFHRYIRMGLAEYAAAISIIFFIAIPHAGELASLDRETLPVSHSFRPTDPDRSIFFVKFWELPVSWIFAALIPGAIITTLFFFDHEVSSIICTIQRYGTRKPGGYALDIALLGTTTALCGILGIPPANGLLPQAPLHSESLMHDDAENIQIAASGGNDTITEVRSSRRVYEQRWSHFLHAAGILAFVSPPLMKVLGVTPTSVLAGLFLFMGEQSLSVNPILLRTFYILTPPSELPSLPPSIKSYASVHLYTLAQIVITVIIFIVTLTKAGPVFPVIIILLVPLRLLAMNRIWSSETLRYVDAWACRDGTPEDDRERRERARKRAHEAVALAFAEGRDVELGSLGGGAGSGAATHVGEGGDTESIVLRPVSRSSRKESS